MRRVPMKKLLLIPTVVVTVFLALAFLMPATAANMVKSVAPVAHLSLNSIFSAASGNGAIAQPGVGAAAARSSSSQASSSSSGTSSTLQGSTDQMLVSKGDNGAHEVATAAHPNCGRFGNGFHGGKHDFTCPNRPFPAPAS